MNTSLSEPCVGAVRLGGVVSLDGFNKDLALVARGIGGAVCRGDSDEEAEFVRERGKNWQLSIDLSHDPFLGVVAAEGSGRSLLCL